MSGIVIQLDDRAIFAAREGRLLDAAPMPSSVFDGSGAEPAGTYAWHELRLRPTAVSTRHLSSVLSDEDDASERNVEIAGRELERRLAEWAVEGKDRAWILTPALATARGLGRLVNVAHGLPLEIEGLVDSATLTVAALGLEHNAIVLELGLHHAAATAVDAAVGQARRRRAVGAKRVGLIGLYQSWMTLISAAMVRKLRFDPLHDAATEQRLFDAIPLYAQEVAANGSCIASVSKGVESFDVTLTRDQWAEAAASTYREITRLIHELRPAGAPVAIVMARQLAELPGLREELEQFVGCELVIVVEGFAAIAAASSHLPLRSPGQAVRLLRRLPLNTAPPSAHLVVREALGAPRLAGPPPSHVLLEGRAYSFGTEPLIVGRAPDAPPVLGGSRFMVLPEGHAGLSRRHCTFVQDNGQIVLLDHSSFGTFVNGERVSERVRVHAGDRIRLGDPGVELALIAVGEMAAG